MDWKMFTQQLEDCHLEFYFIEGFPEQVVIRTEHGDHELAACHRSTDGKTLILDLGQPVQEDV